MDEQKDWLVTAYDENDATLAVWVISDRTEQAAFREAESDVIRLEAEDWSMSPLDDEGRDQLNQWELYTKLREHVGHEIRCVSYAGGENIAIECESCGLVLVDVNREYKVD